MRTLVFFHAHPDDEASQTAGTMARAVRLGHRVVVVYGTNGDHGERPPDLPADVSLVAHRRTEAQASADVIGTHRVVWLDYRDSGMRGWRQNNEPGSFHGADVDEAAGRLAAILDEEDADVLITYDWHGGYGHPDHIQANVVGHAAAARAVRRPRFLETTMNRDYFRALRQAALAAGIPMDFDVDAPADDGNPIGTPEAEIRYRVDVSDLIEVKRAALACHASQTSDVGMMLAMPPEQFAMAFGTEWYAEPGRPPEPGGPLDTWPLDDEPPPTT